MIIDCKVQAYYKEKKKGSIEQECLLYDIELYKENKKLYTTRFELQIVAIHIDDESISSITEILRVVRLPDEIESTRVYYIDFHNIGYCYLNGNIYCTTTQINI